MTVMSRSRGVAVATLFVLTAALALPGGALGVVGTNTIAAAPTVPVGEQQVGNTQDGQRYWRVQLGLGDVFTVNWRNTQAPSSSTDRLCILQPDVTDPTYGSEDWRWTEDIAEGASGSISFTATRPGLYVLDFGCYGSRQTYSFTTGVQPYARTGAEVIGAPLIQTAPTVPPGVQQFGSTYDGQRYWRVQLGLGDAVTVNWRNTLTPSSSTDRLCILQPDVTDPTYGSEDWRRTEDIAEGATGITSYTATRPGLYVLDFGCYGSRQTYSFTVAVAPFTRSGAEVVGAPLIQTAPSVPVGVQQLGNTDDGQRFWRVNVARGQVLRVDWRNTDDASSDRDRLCLAPPTVTDPTYSTSGALASSEIAEGSGGVLRYTARTPGAYVLDFECSNEQTYRFTASLLTSTTTSVTATPLSRGRVRVRARVRPASAAGRCEMRATAGSRRVVRRVAVRAGTCTFGAVALGRRGRVAKAVVRYLPAAGFVGSSGQSRVRLR